MDQLNVDGARPAVARVAALPPGWTTDADRLVLLAVACDSFDGDTSAPGADNLAAWTGLHRSTVYDVVRRLQQPTSERPALLVVEETTRGRRRTRYRLTLPDPEPSGQADGSASRQPSGEPDGWTTPTVGQPSGNRPVSPTVQAPQPSANRRPRADTPFPSNPPTPSQALEEGSPGAMRLVELVAEELPTHLRPDRAQLVRSCSRLAADQWTPEALTSWLDRQRWPTDGGPGLAVHRLDQLEPEDRRPAGRTARTRADARRCDHGQVDGMTVRGAGHNASRVCPQCEAEAPAEEAS